MTSDEEQAPLGGGRFCSVVDDPLRLGLEHAGDVPGEELLVLREIEAVRPRYGRADRAEGRDERADDHGVSPGSRDGDAVFASVLRSDLHQGFREASSSFHFLGGERCGAGWLGPLAHEMQYIREGDRLSTLI